MSTEAWSASRTSWGVARRVLSVSLLRDRVMPPEVRNAHRIGAALNAMTARWPDLCGDQTDGPSPIFVLSAGWGSGSTLVQRIVMSDRSVVIWGEPFDHAAIIQRLASTLAPIGAAWPPDRHFNPAGQSGDLADAWVANFLPPIHTLRSAHQRFYEEWLGKDLATQSGVCDWGLKEVRLTIDHARYLKWLYPRARFVFVYRDLPACYQSSKRTKWYHVWPDYRVSPPLAFAHHWRHLLMGFLAGHRELGAMMVRYEDLAEGATSADDIAGHLGLRDVDPRVTKRKVGSRKGRRRPINMYERLVLNAIGYDLRARLGYV